MLALFSVGATGSANSSTGIIMSVPKGMTGIVPSPIRRADESTSASSPPQTFRGDTGELLQHHPVALNSHGLKSGANMRNPRKAETCRKAEVLGTTQRSLQSCAAS